MKTKILKATSKGQITLPKKWRDKFKSDNFFAEINPDRIIIKPLELETEEKWELLFDADLDNDGEGILVDDLIKRLKKIIDG